MKLNFLLKAQYRKLEATTYLKLRADLSIIILLLIIKLSFVKIMKLPKKFQDDVLISNRITFLLESKLNVKEKLYLNIMDTNFLSDK